MVRRQIDTFTIAAFFAGFTVLAGRFRCGLAFPGLTDFFGFACIRAGTAVVAVGIQIHTLAIAARLTAVALTGTSAAVVAACLDGKCR